MAKNVIICALFLLMLSSCVSTRIDRHLRLAKKHLDKAESLGAQVRVDTIYKTIQVIVPEVKTDTLVKQVTFRDTLFLERDKIKIRLKVDTVKKSVYIAVECPPDTLKIEVPVTVTKEIKTSFPWWYIVIAFVCGGFVVYLIRRR
jgi:hypothetical protein